MRDGHIIDDPNHPGQFMTDVVRPGFKACVDGILGQLPQPGTNICHCVCFTVIEDILCDIVNTYQQSAKAQADRVEFVHGIHTLSDIFGPGLAPLYNLKVVTQAQRVVMQQYELDMNTFEQNVFINIHKNTLRPYFSHLNSSPFNLRYPANLAVNWNQSVGASYDSSMWCYYNGANVTGDHTALVFGAPVPWNAYGPANSLPQPGVAGLYIMHSLDHYFLNRMYDDITPYIHATYLNITKAVDTGRNYLYSSSNAFNKPANPQASQTAVYFLNTGNNTWRLW